MRIEGFLGTRASLLTDVELLLGLFIVIWMLLGLRKAWQGRILHHVRHMNVMAALMLAFLLLFAVNAALKGNVEAVGAATASPAFFAILFAHVVLSVGGGLGLLLVMLWGWRLYGSENPDPALCLRHARWGHLMTGFWFVNGLLGALVYVVAYVL